MKYLIWPCLLALLLCSCANPTEEKNSDASRPDDSIVVEKTAATPIESPSREAIFTYGAGHLNSPQITLAVNDEPLLIGDKYLLLVGLMPDDPPLALVEVSGSGRRLSVGETLLGYRVSLIGQTKIILRREGANNE